MSCCTLGSVEHPCYRCTATLEDGVAFCPECHAPQIRVATPENASNSTELLPSEAAPFAPALTVISDNSIDWRRAFPTAAWAGLIAAILMIVPLGSSFGVGMLAAGFLAIVLYRRRTLANLSPWMGAQLGAVSGALGFVIFSIFAAIAALVFHSGGEVRASMLEAMRQSAARSSDPHAQQVLEFLKTTQGLWIVFAFGMIAMFVVFVILSSLGGVMGAILLRNRNRG
ncbi:MAG: hypothetical protein JOY93_07440 [Acidobacteriales bacterium]|nr:hypothetical protein [Terriglobales bacterium]